MKAILKFPFDQKDNVKLICKNNRCALWFEPITKSWNFAGNSIPEEINDYVVDGSIIEDIPVNITENLDWPDFESTEPLKPLITKNTNQKEYYTYCIDFPFELKEQAGAHSLTWHSLYKTYLLKTTEVSKHLIPYLSQPFSYEAWIEFFINKKVRPEIKTLFPNEDVWQAREHQLTASAAAVKAFNNNYSGFLIADEVGLGKTISAVSLVRNLENKNKEKIAKTILVVTTVSACAHWRNTFLKFNMNGHQILIINYDRLQKLFKPQDDNYKKKAKSKKTKNKRLTNSGLPPVFDLCIWDESHKMKNNISMRSKLGRKISDNAQFNLYLSATAGQNPLELSYLIPLLSSITGQKASTMDDFENWCKSQDLGVKRAEFGKWVWDGTQKSIDKIQNLLFKRPVPGAIRRNPQDIAGWPEINREMTPIEIQPEQITLYQTAWEEFKQLKKQEVVTKKQDKKISHLVANLRFRQKASLLKIDSTVEYILNGLENNHQVAVSVAFIESLNEIQAKLLKQNISCSVIHGKLNPTEKEQNRMDFQTGKNKVVLFTVEEAISLHQGEHNDAPRMMLIHDLRWSAISMSQIEGRTHRDGKFSQIYWMFLTNTIEQDIAQIVLRRVINMKSMIGDDTQTLKEIEELLLKNIDKN